MYSAQAGDTFAAVARKVYGSEGFAGRVRTANPGLTEPLPAGAQVLTPGAPEVAQVSQWSASSPTECAAVIDGQRFRYWTSAAFTQAVDSIDTLELVCPFDPNEPAHRQFFKPFKFQSVQFLVGGQVVFTGVSLGASPNIEPDGVGVSLKAYASCGVLQDCTLPISALPMEFDGLNFRQIAERVAAHFGISVTVDGDPGAVFEDDGKVSLQASDPVLNFLSSLAAQRNYVLTSKPDGGLWARQFVSPDGQTDTLIKTQAPAQLAARLVQGQSPLVSVSAEFNPQQFYSHITALEYADVETGGAAFTARNTLCPTLRPLNFAVQDAEEAGVKTAALAKLGRMYAGMATYRVTVATWLDAKGQRWAPGAAVSLHAPGAMVYAPYTLMIRAVDFLRDSTSETATLELVLPVAFTGAQPERLPWDS
jgi:prophage tail gpP-like protein/phage tail protein X